MNHVHEIPETSQWLNVSESAKYLSVSKATLYSYMKDRKLPFYYLSGSRHRRLRKEDLMTLLVLGDPNEVDVDTEE